MSGQRSAPDGPAVTWTADELAGIGGAEELGLATVRPDGTLRPLVTMGVVRAERIRTGGVERDVAFTEAATGPHPVIDAAYHARYAGEGGTGHTPVGIDLPMRELITFALLVALGGCDPQVRGHAVANRNVGNGRSVLIAVITQLLPFTGHPRVLNALAAIDGVAPESEEV